MGIAVAGFDDRARQVRRSPVAKERTAPDHGGRSDALWLQRMVGNRAAAQVLARDRVDPATYLRNIPGERADDDWMREQSAWRDGLDYVALKVSRGEAWLPMEKVEDTSMRDAERLLGALRGLAQLATLTDADRYRSAIQAVRWYEGIKPRPVSGFHTLDVDVKAPFTFRGRPAFPSYTQRTMGVKSKQHRRHIFAWHDIREFMSLSYRKYGKTLTDTLRGLIANPRAGTQQAMIEALRYTENNTPDKLNEKELVKVSLFVMNGNLRNLWVGSASTNISINTVGRQIREKLATVTDFDLLAAVGRGWETPTSSDISTNAKQLGRDIIKVACREWDAVKGGLQEPAKQQIEKAHLQRALQTLNHWILSNLEMDAMGDNAPIYAQWNELAPSIRTMDSVVQGDDRIGWDQARDAIVDLMTYEK